jgi:ferric-dicitrate binding protein FerR (iron transport regulator)
MSSEQSRRPGDRESASDHELRDLFAHVGPREVPPAADTAEIRAALYAEWDAMTGRRVRFRRFASSAAAAVFLAAGAWLVLDRPPPTAPVLVARVERVQGRVELEVDGDSVALRAGDPVAQGTMIETGRGLVALRLESGGSLRLASQTRVSVDAANAVALETGAVYFDSEGARRAGEPLTIATPFGTVRDVGTQFVTEVEATRLEVGVRDGSVSVVRDDDRVAAEAGEKVTVRDGAAPVREPLATFGEDWAWAERLAPPFEIDGRRLIDFLEWVAAQTGRTLAYFDEATEQAARDTVLTGSIDLEPLQKLEAVLTTTDLTYSIEGARILISPK